MKKNFRKKSVSRNKKNSSKKRSMKKTENEKCFKEKQVGNEYAQYYVMNNHFEIAEAHEGYSKYLLKGLESCNLKLPDGEVFVIDHSIDERSYFSSNFLSLIDVAEGKKQPMYGNLEMSMIDYIEMLHEIEMQNYLEALEMSEDFVWTKAWDDNFDNLDIRDI